MKAAAPFACAFALVSPAQLWLPDVVSTEKPEVRIAFSPDGNHMLWGAIGWSNGSGGWDIYESVREKNGWSTPHVVSFDSSANDFDPAFAPDGSGVYFFSNRDGGFGKDDIYFAPFDASKGAYGPAENLGKQINSAGDEWAPSVSADGKRLMFASDGHGGRGKHDLQDGVSVIYTSGTFENDAVALYVAQFHDGRYQPRERLPVAVNSQKQGAWTFGPSISAHDPGALYFTSQHEQARGRADIYRIEYRIR
jgi:hypothetical protein